MVLFTSIDGTATFGRGAEALFPSVPPTLTSPPYSDAAFPLYLKPVSEVYEDVIASIFKTLGQPPTPLNTAFFAKDNVDEIQRALVRAVRETLGQLLGRQSDWELLLIMRQVYLDSASNWPEDVAEELVRLNGLVLQISLQAVSSNLTRYMAYRAVAPMAESLPMPAELMTGAPYVTGAPSVPVNQNGDWEENRADLIGTGAPIGKESFVPAAPDVWGVSGPREANISSMRWL